ncbi:hypothetical protein [Leptospira phage LE3]|uniref:Uncharacterized protein n=1 Tax=Leptospira phage LE3 TaxID=2041382 RepID=A0A343LE29_9CAUD|nr:hypothetical protein HWB33_gp55 [Leptospira phage LE3]ATN94939.1 hypothetical protein [Leptospira phage LE3]
MENQTQQNTKRELVENQKKDFFHILKTLNHYYKMTKTKPSGHLFREKITEDQVNTKVQIEKLGPYEFKITAQNGEQTESWIHLDGVQEEKTKFPKDHPVHSIVCMTDIYEASK